MNAITYTQVQKDLQHIMNRVCEDHIPLIITHQNQDPVVLMSLKDYNATQETLYLLRSPRNAQRLRRAIQDLRKF